MCAFIPAGAFASSTSEIASAGSITTQDPTTPDGFTYYVGTLDPSIGYGAYIYKWSGGPDVVVPATLGGVDVVSVDIYTLGLTSIDVSAATNLIDLSCGNNLLTSIDVSKNKKLKYFSCSNNSLISIDVSANTQLLGLFCERNPLNTLDVRANTVLDDLHCSYNLLTSLDVSQNVQLTDLVCENNSLTSLDVSHNPRLRGITSSNNPLGSLDVSTNTQLIELRCDNNLLTSLDVSNNTLLRIFDCYSNSLTSLDVSNNTLLEQLNCYENSLNSLDVSGHASLRDLYCYSNSLTSLDVSGNTWLLRLYCYENSLTSLDVSTDTRLQVFCCNDNRFTSLDVSHNAQLKVLRCQNNYIRDTSALEAWLATAGHESQVLPQSRFNISTASLSPIYEQTWTGGAITPEPVVTFDGNALVKDTDYTLSYTNNVDLGTATVTITGIGNYTGSASENFTITPFVYQVVTDGSGPVGNGTYITDVVGTTTPSVPATLGGASVVSVKAVVRALTSLDVSAVSTLRYLYCEQNSLTTLDVSSNTELRELICNLNSITSLDVSANTDLMVLACDHNLIASLDVSHNTQLTELHCNYNALTSLNLSGASALNWLDCNTNSLTSLDVSSNTLLEWLDCDTNQILALDLSHNLALGVLYCYGNALISLDTSANSLITDIYCNDNYIIHTSALENWLSLGYSGQILPQNSVDIANASITLAPDTYVYIGSAITPAPSLVYSNGADAVNLIENTDYTCSYSDNVDIGTATIFITGMGNCTGMTSVTFNIVSADISSASIASVSDQIWTGSAITPPPVVTFNGIVLANNTDYTLGYADNTNIGTATITITGIGNFTGTTSTTFEIVKRDMSHAAIAPISNMTYTGSALTPLPVVTFDGITLVEDTDYTLGYADNVNAGTATVTVTGIGHYAGTTSAIFNIVSANIASASIASVSDQTWTGSAITPLPFVTYSGTTLTKDTDYTLAYLDNTNAGTATVIITGIGHYRGNTSTTFNITPKSIASTVIASISKKLYVGIPVEPVLHVTDGAITLVSGVDYTLSYTNNTLNGTATATITGMGNYTATNATNFTVVRFSDVSYDMWYITDGWLTYVVENNLMGGYAGTTDFGPFDFISRAQVATVLYRAACKDDPSLVSIYGSTTDPSHYATTTVFVDEAVGVYYTAAINWAQAAGIMTGYAPEYRVVAPDNMISREELCTMIARYVRVVDPTKGAQTGPVDYSNIRGMDEVSDWALANVKWCASWGIVGGLNMGGGVFVMNPHDAAWHASIAKTIAVALRDVMGD